MATFQKSTPATPGMNSGAANPHIPFPTPAGTSRLETSASGEHGRSPPQGTPSSYGRFIQKRGRVGSLSVTKSALFISPCAPLFWRSQLLLLETAHLNSSFVAFQGGGAGRAGSMDRPRGMSTSISGRLRSVSDLERSGFVTSSEKGRLKDLIISGDESLRAALEK
jgi:hypothetical protein